MNFSKQLHQIRMAHQMTQVNLAEQLHVSRHTVSNWENDRNLPDSRNGDAYCQNF